VKSERTRREWERYWNLYRRYFPKYFWSERTRLADVVIERAEGSYLIDVDGKKYIDLTSQWATNNVGNVHPEILEATIKALRQYGFLIFFMNPHVPMFELAEKLLDVRPSKNLTRVSLELSGTGAVEAALKYAIGSKRVPMILSFMGQYHGLSLGTINVGSLSSEERAHFEAQQGGVLHAPYPFPYRAPARMEPREWGEWVLGYVEDEILRYLSQPERIAAAIFEPIACEAGVWMPPDNFIPGLKKLCEKYGWFYIDDEVETGMGRTGKMWAIEHDRVAPDLMPIGKGISGGLMPIAAVLGSDETMAEEAIAAGTTFGGHPAACAAASATLEVMKREKLPERASRLGTNTLKYLKEWEGMLFVGEVRGRGLLFGIELVRDKKSKAPDPDLTRNVFFRCVERGVIPLYNYGDNVLRVEPCLTVEEEVLQSALETMEDVLRSMKP